MLIEMTVHEDDGSSLDGYSRGETDDARFDGESGRAER